MEASTLSTPTHRDEEAQERAVRQPLAVRGVRPEVRLPEGVPQLLHLAQVCCCVLLVRREGEGGHEISFVVLGVAEYIHCREGFGEGNFQSDEAFNGGKEKKKNAHVHPS